MSSNIIQLLLIIALGLLAVTIIDVFGSVTSRKWKYNYSYLTPLSLIVYAAIGFYTAPKFSLNWALILGSLVGIFDATIGWKIALRLNADMGSQKEKAMKTDTSSRVLFMIVVSSIFGFIGAMLGG